MLRKLPVFESDKLIVGLDTSDDAAVYKLDDEKAAILTLDFFTPIVDDPYAYGQIAAANALSDVYAMGGEPIMALNIVGFPNCLDPDILSEIMRGGAEKVKEAGGLLVGGHSIEDDEPKYGLAVMGLVHPDAVLANAGARVGDVLILTKPIGLGVLNTAMKADLLSPEEIKEVIHVMAKLNKYAAHAMKGLNINGCTDITGFGLLGHVYEMAAGSHVTIELNASSIPIMSGAKSFAEMGIIPAGAYRNADHIKGKYTLESIDEATKDLLFDPQTSGGLLISLPPDDAEVLLKRLKETLDVPFAKIGRVISEEEKAIRVIR